MLFRTLIGNTKKLSVNQFNMLSHIPTILFDYNHLHFGKCFEVLDLYIYYGKTLLLENL